MGLPGVAYPGAVWKCALNGPLTTEIVGQDDYYVGRFGVSVGRQYGGEERNDQGQAGRLHVS
jgi:hypothetical protein